MQTTNPVDSSLPTTQDAVIPFEYDIRFVDCDPSDAVRFLIEEHLSRLSRFYDRITDARVHARIPHKHGGVRFFHIHVQLDVPGKRIVASREPEANDKHLDIGMAVRDAFHKVTRQLEDFVKFRKEHNRAQ